MNSQTIIALGSEFIDLYCERTGAGLLGEPFNLISNLAFVLVGFWQLNRSKVLFPRLAGALAILVGIGSFFFHAYPTRLAQAADVLPIFFLISSLFFYYQIRVLGWKIWQAFIGMLFLFLASMFSYNYLKFPIFNGSEGYLGTLIVLGLLSVRERNEVNNWIFRAFVLFACAVWFRTLDPRVCPIFPVGSHFLWHLFNAFVIGCVFKSLDMPHLKNFK